MTVRLFDPTDGSDYLQVDVAPVTAAPLTMACWFKPDTISDFGSLLQLVRSTSAVSQFSLRQTQDKVQFLIEQTLGTTVVAVTTTSIVAGVWQHACGVCVSDSSRSVYLDGGGKDTVAGLVVPPGVNRTAIGMLRDNTPTNPYEGLLAFATIWNVALSDAEVAELAAGACPTSIQPDAIVFNVPIRGDDPETDLSVNANHMTVVGTTTVDGDDPAVNCDPPAAPSGLTATPISSDQIDLSWTDNSSDEDGFTIERSPAGAGTWVEIDDVAANVTVYSDTNLDANTAYDYRVKAFNDNGDSAYSNTATATTPAPEPAPPVRVEVSFEELGCGIYTLYLQERGGFTRVGQLAWNTLGFGRVLDDISSAEVETGIDGLLTRDEVTGLTCCEVLERAEPWEHELAIYRDALTEPVWVGPLIDLDITDSGAQVKARDVFQWLERREQTIDREHTAQDLSDIFETYFDDAMDQENSAGLVLAKSLSGVLGDRAVDGSERPRSADLMRELADSGVDFTVIGRSVIIGGENLPVDPLVVLTDEAIWAPQWSKRGLDAVTEATVRGTFVDGETVSATAGGSDPRLGLLQQTYSDPRVRDNASAVSSSIAIEDSFNPSPVYLTLNLTQFAPVRFDRLIPGARVDVALRLVCLELIGTYRLQEVRVSALADSGDENVQLSLIPVGIGS